MGSSKFGWGVACLLICGCYQGHDEQRALTGAPLQVSRDDGKVPRAGGPAKPKPAHGPDASTPALPPCVPTVDAAMDDDAGTTAPGARALSVSTYNQTTCALLEDRTVRCWGDNSQGTLGEGTFIDSSQPVQVHDLGQVVQLDVGLLRACAVVEGGGLRCWGDNLWDVMRVGDELDHNLPVTAQSLEHVAQVSLGEHQTCVRYMDNTLECWGYPHLMDTVQDVSDVTGVEAGYFLNVATLRDGSVRSWGENGLAGPVDVSSSLAVSSGYGFVCILTPDATVRCQGIYNVHETVPRFAGLVPGLSDVVSLSSGFEHSCAITRAGKVFCWGRDNRGQLGDGVTAYRTEAREVPNLEHVVEVTCGREHTCARTQDGSIYCWGSNDKGELGDGTTTERHSPVLVRGL